MYIIKGIIWKAITHNIHSAFTNGEGEDIQPKSKAKGSEVIYRTHSSVCSLTESQEKWKKATISKEKYFEHGNILRVGKLIKIHTSDGNESWVHLSQTPMSWSLSAKQSDNIIN